MQQRDLHEELENWQLAARRFETLFQRLPIPCLGFDLEGTIFEWNRECETQLGGMAAVLFMRQAQAVLCSSPEQEELFNGLLDNLALGESTEGLPWTLAVPDHEPRHILLNVIPAIGADGSVGGGLLVWTDVTDLKEYEQQIESQLTQIHEYSAEIEMRRQELELANNQLSTLASTDGLTGLANHRTFQESLRHELTLAHKGKLSIILLDVDHFKRYNDTHGHPQGDIVLKGVGEALREGIRKADLVARYGGEEFVVLLPGAGKADAMVIAERMRAAIEQRQFPKDSVTASFGVATLSTDCPSAEELIQSADEALYASKARGRNCVTHAGEIRRAA